MSAKEPSIRDVRRGQIIAAARRIVAEQGLDALTFGSLEKELSFTRGVITWHFEDKHEILSAVLESAVAEMDEDTFVSARIPESFADKVRAVLDSKVRGFLVHREAAQILVAFWTTPVPGTAALNAALFQGWRAQAAHLFKVARANRQIADVDVDAMAGLLVGLVLGIVVQTLYAGPVPTDALVDEAARCVIARCRRYDPVPPSSFVD